MRTIDAMIGAFLIGLALLVVPGWLRPRPAIPSTTDTVVRPWLEAMRKGGDGFQYWIECDGPPRVAFYAVSAYEILDDSPFSGYKVRIHSSTRDGTPIVKVYEVLATSGGIYRVTAQGDDPDAHFKETLNRLREAVKASQEPTEAQKAVQARRAFLREAQ